MGFMKKVALLLSAGSIICIVFSFSCHAAVQGADIIQGKEKVSIDFNNVDIRMFIKFISRLTGKNFVVDTRVKGRVTIISPSRLSVKDAYRVFESVLEMNGYSTVRSGKIIKIIPVPKAKSDNLETMIMQKGSGEKNPEDRMVTRIIPLTYARADELKKMLVPLMPAGSIILSYRDTNMLIITASLSSINRLFKIIKSVDVKSIGKKISIIPVRHADVKKMVKSLSEIFNAGMVRPGMKSVSGTPVRLVADERTNTIIILADRTDTGRITKLLSMLDRQVPRGEEKIRVYYLEHASAKSVAEVLQQISAGSSSSTKINGRKKPPALSSGIKITADKSTNSLIITADKEDYPVLEKVIKKLDIPRAMVYIECLIMEVKVTSGLNIGTEWKTFKKFDNGHEAVFSGFGGTGDSGFSNLGGLSGSGTLPKGFSLGVLGRSFKIGNMVFPDIQAVIQAYRNSKDVNIISTPQILTTENEEASITVGKNVPYQTKSAAESGSTTYNSFEYKDVGIELKITPHISKDRLVRLNVFQKLTKLDSVSQQASDRPTTLKREIKTTIIVKDGNSVVIGGLIDDSLTTSQTATPCLGDIPGLGWAFKSMSRGREKTNLYVFLTPRVIRNPVEVKKIYKEKSDDISRFQKEEIILYGRPGKGSCNGD